MHLELFPPVSVPVFPAHANLSAVGIGALEEPDVARGCLVRRATSGVRIVERDAVCALIDFSQ